MLKIQGTMRFPLLYDLGKGQSFYIRSIDTLASRIKNSDCGVVL